MSLFSSTAATTATSAPANTAEIVSETQLAFQICVQASKSGIAACPQCKTKLQNTQVETIFNHVQKTCSKALIQCPDCMDNIPRGLIDSHQILHEMITKCKSLLSSCSSAPLSPDKVARLRSLQETLLSVSPASTDARSSPTHFREPPAVVLNESQPQPQQTSSPRQLPPKTQSQVPSPQQQQQQSTPQSHHTSRKRNIPETLPQKKLKISVLDKERKNEPIATQNPPSSQLEDDDGFKLVQFSEPLSQPREDMF